MIKNVFFDVDDTILSYKKSFAPLIEEMFGKYNFPYDIDEVKRVYAEQSKPLWASLARGEITGVQFRLARWPNIFKALNLPAAPAQELEDTFRLALSHQYPLEEGALEVFKYLKQKGYRIFIASNAVQWCQEERLEKSGLLEYIDAVFCSDKIEAEKPSKKFYDIVLRETDSKPEESIMIGDEIKSDIAGGKNAGLKACWYNPNGKEDTVGADYVIANLSDLMKIL